MTWDPQQYAKFKKERARPFFDLLTQLEGIQPKTIADLGCGTGELTAALASKWPEAKVTGVDSSPEMISKAKPWETERLRFEIGGIEEWRPEAPMDLIFSNAAFHWLRDHEVQLERISSLVAPGGTLAFQAPNQFAEPSHTIIQELRNAPEWKNLIGRDSSDGYVASAAWYLSAFRSWGFACNVWETIYYQVLQGDNAVLEWLKGTALRQVLAELDTDQQQRFLEQCGTRLREAYPKKESGTLFPYRRMFVVVRKQG